jgi:hypothetical protein
MKTHITCAFSSPWCLCYNFFELCGKCVANMRIGRIIEYDHENCNTNPTINWTNNSIWSWEIETNQYVKQQKKKKTTLKNLRINLIIISNDPQACTWSCFSPFFFIVTSLKSQLVFLNISQNKSTFPHKRMFFEKKIFWKFQPLRK